MSGFDFAAMQNQGNTAGVSALYVMIMTPLPRHAPVPPGIGILNVASRVQAEEIARNEPFHAMGWRHNAVMEWTPKFGSLIEVFRDISPAGR